jgi:hypothetical protein
MDATVAADERPTRPARQAVLPVVDKVDAERHAWYNLTGPMLPGGNTRSASGDLLAQVLQDANWGVSLLPGRRGFV